MPQVVALPRLCNQLSLAEGLRELVLRLEGRATGAVPIEFAALARLTQLDTLQLGGVSLATAGEHFTAALSPLTRLRGCVCVSTTTNSVRQTTRQRSRGRTQSAG